MPLGPPAANKRQQEEIRLNALRALLAEGDLVQGMREALAGAIFRMQTPLNLVAAAATMLERRPGGNSNGSALLDVLRQALESGRQALETLRSSMPGEPRDPRVPVNINQLLHEVLMVSTPRLLACGVVVEWRPAVTLPALTGQENRLRGMLKQVIANALDAMAERGQTRRELRLATRATDDVVDIVVQDTGPGIPERLRLKVFEPFFTTKGATGHSAGVGLTMAQQVVNEHGGSITIDPDYTEGCRVRIQLPLRQAREAGD